MLSSTLIVVTALIGSGGPPPPNSGDPIVTIVSPKGNDSLTPSASIQAIDGKVTVTFPANTPGSTACTVKFIIFNQATGLRETQSFSSTVANVPTTTFRPTVPAGSSGDAATVSCFINYTDGSGNAVQGSQSVDATYGP